ncbi:MAG: TonB-dependent receptor [Longimicrobiaceae bacterium]
MMDKARRFVHSGPGAMLLLLNLFVAVLALPAQAQQPRGEPVSLFGRVTDEADAPVAGAVVTLTESGAGPQRRTTLTDAEGAYRLVGLPAGRHRIVVAHLGYANEEREVSLAAGERRRLDFTLRIEAVALEGIDVRARRDAARERARFETEAGVTARVVSAEQIKLLPGLAEADVLRSIEVLPGVISTSDFSSAFNVRGGSADQNLILLDGFPIFNPFHLGGLFSVFNSDALARAELFAGGFSAEYGGRVSSVLTVESRTGGGEGEGLRGEAGVSLLASRLALHGNLPAAVPRLLGGREGGWLLSGRRSYFDKLLAPVVDFPYHLTDLQGHVNVGVAGGGRLRLTGYTGRDVLDLSNFTPPGSADAESVLRLRWNWGNDVLGARWEQPLRSGAWLVDTRAGFSRFRDELVLLDFDDTRFGGAISQLMLRSDLRGDLGSASVATGIELSRMEYENSAETGGTSFFLRADRGLLGSGYGTLRWRPGESWIVEPGARVDVWKAADTTRATFSPRLAVKRFLGSQQEAAVKLAVGRYTQFLHSLRNEDFPLSNDVWILAGPSVPVVVSDQLQLGVERFWGEEWYASVEAYGRLFRGVTEFNPAGDPNDPSDDVHDGTGHSYGLDLLVRRSMGRLTGWTTVSLLRAERSFPNPLADGWEDLPPTVSFPPIFDRRVDVDLVLEYRLPWEVQAGARWNFGSGLPYTRPVAQFVGWEYDLRDGDYRLPTSRPRGDGVPLYVVLGSRNTQRYPAYHRLDMTLRRSFHPRWGTLTPYLQVLNGYNRRNVLFYFYNYNRNPPTRSGISMFPLLPTIGVDASF